MPFNENDILKKILQAGQVQEEPVVTDFEDSLQQAEMEQDVPEIPELTEMDQVALEAAAPERAPAAASASQEEVVEEANDIVEAQNAPKDYREEVLEKYRNMIAQQEELLGQKKERSTDDKVMDWVTAIGQAATNIKQPNNTAPSKVQYWGDRTAARDKGAAQDRQQKMSTLQSLLKNYLSVSGSGGEGMTEYQKKALGLREKELELKKEKSKDKPTFEEKEEKKFQIKQKLERQKQDNELKKQLNDTIPGLDDQLDYVRTAKQAIKNADSSMSATGPIDQYIAPFTEKGQKIQQALNQISLDKMTKMFQGMSKAIDSDAERAFFQSAQPSLGKYESVNLEMLDKMEKNLESLKQKSQAKLKDIKSGRTSDEPQKEQAKDPKIEQYAEQYNLDYNKAESILRARGYDGR